jgi:Flp pilus assembly protein TadG
MMRSWAKTFKIQARPAANWKPLAPHGEEGSSLVEFALSAAVFFMMLIGIMELSVLLFTFHFVSEAAREGSRYAMVRGNSSFTNCPAASTPCPTSQTAIQTYVRGLALVGLNPANMTVTATYSAFPSGGTCTPNTNCENAGNLVTVKVIYAYPLNLPFVRAGTLGLGSHSNTVNLTSTSAMIISQ